MDVRALCKIKLKGRKCSFLGAIIASVEHQPRLSSLNSIREKSGYVELPYGKSEEMRERN